MSQIAEMLSREEIMEKQRSRIDRLKTGDRNTSLFQAKAKERTRSNRIRVLKRDDRTMVTEKEEIEQCARQIYQELFLAQQNLHAEEILRFVPSKVTMEMNEELTRPYTKAEGKRALFMMGPDKALGPDGFTAGFFQYHSDLAGPSVTQAVLKLLNEGILADEVNLTTIVLIPKVSNPLNMKQFRPISLCNVIYKICSKVLANHMKVFLDEIISDEQSAFVPWRLITNNVLFAYECTHYLKRKKREEWGVRHQIGYDESI